MSAVVPDIIMDLDLQIGRCVEMDMHTNNDKNMKLQDVYFVSTTHCPLDYWRGAVPRLRRGSQ